MKHPAPKQQPPTPGANAPRHAPEVFPAADDPLFQKPGVMRDMVDKARGDFGAMTEQDIENAFAEPEKTITPGTPEKRLASEGMDAVSIGSDVAEIAVGDVAMYRKEIAKNDAAMREIEDGFRTRHGIELRDENKNPFGKRVKLWILRRSSSPIDTDALNRYEQAKGMKKLNEREISYQTLALKDRTTRGALSQLSRSLREMEQRFYDSHGMSVRRDESPAELHARFKKIAQHDPHALGMLRTYLEAREQLSRLEKAAGISE